MSNFFGTIHRLATKVEIWWSLCSLTIGTGLMSWVTAQWQAIAAQGWAAVFIVALLCCCCASGAVASIFFLISKLRSQKSHSTRGEKSFTWNNTPPHIKVFGKKFVNEQVVLDGGIFRDCRFQNVTFIFNGTEEFQFSDNHIIGSINMATVNPAVFSTILFMKGLGALSETFKLDLPPGMKVESPTKAPPTKYPPA